MNDVNVTGTMVKPKDGWQERVDRLVKVENFKVFIDWSQTGVAVRDQLTVEERSRLARKLDLVEKFATFMAAGMLKGTLKYSTDNYSIDQWMAHLIGEGADQANYAALLFDSYTKFKEDLDRTVDAAIEENRTK